MYFTQMFSPLTHDIILGLQRAQEIQGPSTNTDYTETDSTVCVYMVLRWYRIFA